MDAEGCAKYPDGDIIVVCGTPEEQRDRKMFQNEKAKDRIRRGEGISSTRAVARDMSGCSVIGSGLGCIVLPSNPMPFGKVPVPAIPLEEVMRGLAPQDQVNSAKEP